jgi:hypothetical protein
MHPTRISSKNRDANSATNILNLAKCYLDGSTRPTSFCRPKSDDIGESVTKSLGEQPKNQIKPVRLSLVPFGIRERETIRIDFVSFATGVRSPAFSQ